MKYANVILGEKKSKVINNNLKKQKLNGRGGSSSKFEFFNNFKLSELSMAN